MSATASLTHRGNVVSLWSRVSYATVLAAAAVALGLVATPGVAIDGKVVVSGRIPKAEEIRHILGLE